MLRDLVVRWARCVLPALLLWACDSEVERPPTPTPDSGTMLVPDAATPDASTPIVETDAGTPDAGPSSCVQPKGPPPSPLGSSLGFLGQRDAIALDYDGCNSVVYAQVPGSTDDFLGRKMNNTSPADPCNGNGGHVARYRMDWAARKLRWVSEAFAVPQLIQSGSYQVISAYDPTITAFNGELWATFECISPTSRTADACLGPYNPATGKIDPARTVVAAVGGNANPNDPYIYSASVPYVLGFKGKVYLYWTAVKIRDADNKWDSLTARGMELTQESAGLRRLWAAGVGGPVKAYDPARNIEVWGLGSDNQSNKTADLQGLFADGDYLYAIAALGGEGCLEPNGSKPGCYRMAISRTREPLVPGGFGGGYRLPPEYLPSNAHNYTRLAIKPDGSRNLLGAFYAAYPGAPNVVPGNILLFPIPKDAAYFSPPAAAPESSEVMAVSLDALHDLHGGCSAGTLFSSGCSSAIARYCQRSFGYVSGYGPVEAVGNTAHVVCMGSKVAVARDAPFEALDPTRSACTWTSSDGVPCDAAVNRSCGAQGYVGGTSISEYSATSAAYACVNTCAADALKIPWAEVTASFADCSRTLTSASTRCLPAANRLCKARGYTSGFGVQDVGNDVAQVRCVR